tara:strand:- start:240 stop:620 length:381 start_codon:yes stop_codon:yes gene_type:complete
MFLRYNIFSIIFLVILLVGCLLPGSTLPKSDTQNLDKVLHVLLFLCFTFCSLVGCVKQSQYPILHYFALKYVTIFSVLLTVLIELIQHFFIPRRGFELLDIGADMAGITLAIVLFFFVKGKEKIGY